jgi:hypothetical protein
MGPGNTFDPVWTLMTMFTIMEVGWLPNIQVSCTLGTLAQQQIQPSVALHAPNCHQLLHLPVRIVAAAWLNTPFLNPGSTQPFLQYASAGRSAGAYAAAISTRTLTDRHQPIPAHQAKKTVMWCGIDQFVCCT